MPVVQEVHAFDSAVKTGSIVRIDDSIASRWGPRLVDFFRALSSAINRLRA